MGWLKNLIAKRREYDYPDEEEMERLVEEDAWNEVVYTRDDLDIHDDAQRKEYVQGCLEQISDAAKEIDALSYEYNTVTSYLKDMEEIEALPEHEKRRLDAAAVKVARAMDTKKDFQGRTRKMTDEQFHRLERLEDEVEEALAKLTEAEEYQSLVKKDLGRLDAERQAFRYRKFELMDTLEQSKNLSISCTIMAAAAMLVLLVLQFVMELDAGWGYILVAGAAASVYLILYLKFHEASRELKRLEKDTNRLILLQNRVKIRYVNNTHLLDYLYMKYKVESAKELRTLKDAFEEEREARENYRRAQLDLDENEQELLKLLRCYQVKDPAIWLHQTEAILDHKEMVEIRHGLIVRRQALRKRMDYNREVVAGNAQKEIKDLAETYPRYAKEIMDMVDEYI